MSTNYIDIGIGDFGIAVGPSGYITHSGMKSLRINIPKVMIGSGFTPARSAHIDDVLRIEPRATAPSSPALGDIYVDSTTNELCFYDGTSWTGLKAAGACA